MPAATLAIINPLRWKFEHQLAWIISCALGVVRGMLYDFTHLANGAAERAQLGISWRSFNLYWHWRCHRDWLSIWCGFSGHKAVRRAYWRPRGDLTSGVGRPQVDPGTPTRQMLSARKIARTVVKLTRIAISADDSLELYRPGLPTSNATQRPGEKRGVPGPLTA